MKQCKCEHWQQCPACMPHRFDADGKLLPPEPTPLQAARAQIDRDTALLRQALEALEAFDDNVWPANRKDIIAALRERLGDSK